jgi:cytochrome c
VTRGERTYRRQCARCHGAHAQGKDDQFHGLRAQALVGRNALPCEPRPAQRLRARRFRTAKDVYDFASASMPADEPAILDADEYWDVVAYLLAENGRTPNGTPLDATSAASVVLDPHCPANDADGAAPGGRRS